MQPINIHPITAFKDNYIWIIVNKQKRCALIVDPGEAAPVQAYLKQHHLDLHGIFITHHHGDHVYGVVDLINDHPVPVFGCIRSPYPHLTHRVDEGDSIFISHHFPTYQVLAIPGHTLDHIAYYAQNALFCGDTLFAAGCGRVFEGTMEQLYTSLQKIAALPEQTNIYCGHEYTLQNLHFAQHIEPTNPDIQQRIKQVTQIRQENHPSLPSLLMEEKKTNPFLRCENPDVIEQASRHAACSLKQPTDVFAALRTWKNEF